MPGHELLFSCGALADPRVQRAVFGRELPGESDAVVGHRLERVHVDGPGSVSADASGVRPVLVAVDTTTGGIAGGTTEVAGTVMALGSADLVAADHHVAGRPAAPYRRVRVPLRSGRQAWVYVPTAGGGEQGPRGVSPGCREGA